MKIKSSFIIKNPIKLRGILFVYLIFSANFIFPQTSPQQPLKEVLQLLQEQHQHTFTYADDIIEKIYVNPIPSTYSLQEAINYLRKETGLLFQFLDTNFISISSRNSSFTACGYVLDKETRLPLLGTTIVCKSESTISDNYGYFSFEINNKNETLSIRSIGYKPVSIKASDFFKKGCIYIEMNNEIETLSEIILNNYITKGIDKINDGTLNIDFSNFGILPGLIETDALQTIQSLPSVQSVSETVSDINIRGGTNDQNLILWDGIKMYQSGHFFGLISIFNPQMTKSAKLIKNGTSAAFSDGTSGTISMNTDTNLNKNLDGSLATNLINVDGFLDIPFGKKSSIQLSGRKAINDFVETPTYTSYFDRISQDSEAELNTNSAKTFDFYDLSLRWLYQPSSKDRIRVSGLLVSNELIFNENLNRDEIIESKQSSLAQETLAASVYYRRDWNDKLVTNTTFTESRYYLRAVNADIFNEQSLEQENIVSESSAKINAFYEVSSQLSILGGYQFTETGISNRTEVDNPTFKLNVTEVIREHALYAEANFKTKTKKTNIRFGVRHNYIDFLDKKEHIFEPRININHQFSKRLNIDILGEFKHQNSSQIITGENDFLGVEKRRWQLSNLEDIPITKSKQGSIGLNYKHRGWLITNEGFYKEIQGITTQSQGFNTSHHTINSSGSYSVSGIDLLINKRFEKISSWLSYTFSKNKYEFNEFEISNFPNNLDIRHALSFGTSYTADGLKVSAGVNWHTGRPTTRPINKEIIDGEINYEKENSSRVSDYLRVDTSITYKFELSKGIKIQAGLSIWNLINSMNVIDEYYNLDNNTITRTLNSALNLTPNASLRILF